MQEIVGTTFYKKIFDKFCRFYRIELGKIQISHKMSLFKNQSLAQVKHVEDSKRNFYFDGNMVANFMNGPLREPGFNC